MKTITRPADIAIQFGDRPAVDAAGNPLVFSFGQVVRAILEDPSFQASFVAARIANRIEAAVMRDSPTLDLHDEDHAFLLKVMQTAEPPSLRSTGPAGEDVRFAITRQLVPFFEAVESAT